MNITPLTPTEAEPKDASILVIDDTPASLGVLTNYLENDGYDVMVAQDGQSGLEKASYARPDLILLDIMMPGVDGFETCRQLKSNKDTHDIPVIFITALSDTQSKIKGFEEGSVDYLTKPLQPEEVLTRVRTHLRLRGLQKTLQHKNKKLTRALHKAQESKPNQEIMTAYDAFFRSLIESSSDIITVLNEDGSIRYESFASKQALGHKVDDQIKIDLMDFIHPDDLADLETILIHTDPISSETITLPVEIRIKHWDGSWRTFEAVINNLLNDSIINGVVINWRDITARKMLERREQQIQRIESVRTLAGGIAHHFNNLLTVIIGNCELLHYQVDEKNGIEEFAQIKNATQIVITLISQLVAFSRQQLIRPQVLNINEVIGQLNPVLSQLTGKNINLHIVLDKDLELIEVDKKQIKEVIMTLINNACDAMPEGGELTIETTNVERRYILLTISDTGHGMAAEIQDRIFEPFFTTKPVGEGIGLSLSSTQGFIEQSGGHISVSSEVEQGTTFEIYLPQIKSDGYP